MSESRIFQLKLFNKSCLISVCIKISCSTFHKIIRSSKKQKLEKSVFRSYTNLISTTSLYEKILKYIIVQLYKIVKSVPSFICLPYFHVYFPDSPQLWVVLPWGSTWRFSLCGAGSTSVLYFSIWNEMSLFGQNMIDIGIPHAFIKDFFTLDFFNSFHQ